MKFDEGAIGWETTGFTVGIGHWCEVGIPSKGWDLGGCVNLTSGVAGPRVKVLTYNLFWWNLFQKRQGNDNSAGKLIAKSGKQEPFDIMGFQECNDVETVLRNAREAGMQGSYRTLGPVNPVAGAVAIAWLESVWDALNFGIVEVAEDADKPGQWWGARFVTFVRLSHKQSGAKVFFMNHHGPLPVAEPGGLCGADATAYQLLKVIGYHAHPGDALILVGDFNAGKDSRTVQRLSEHVIHVYNGTSYGGVDNIFTHCAVATEKTNLGAGGSDHDALSAVFQVTAPPKPNEVA